MRAQVRLRNGGARVAGKLGVIGECGRKSAYGTDLRPHSSINVAKLGVKQARYNALYGCFFKIRGR